MINDYSPTLAFNRKNKTKDKIQQSSERRIKDVFFNYQMKWKMH